VFAGIVWTETRNLAAVKAWLQALQYRREVFEDLFEPQAGVILRYCPVSSRSDEDIRPRAGVIMALSSVVEKCLNCKHALYYGTGH
jgi:hypothetical protein